MAEREPAVDPVAAVRNNPYKYKKSFDNRRYASSLSFVAVRYNS